MRYRNLGELTPKCQTPYSPGKFYAVAKNDLTEKRRPARTNELQALLVELTSGDDERAEAAVEPLAAYGQPAVAALRWLISGANSDARWWAVRALAEIKDVQVPPLLVLFLSDEDAAVRQCAALALFQQPDPWIASDLIAALSNEDRLFAHLAANALSAIGQPAVPALLAVLQNGTQVARLEAARALSIIGDTRSIPALFSALSEDSALIEYWANEGLERMGVGMTFFQTD